MSYILTIIKKMEHYTHSDTESLSEDLRSDIIKFGLPASKYRPTGELFIGKRGEDHGDIVRSSKHRDDTDESRWLHGYHNPKTKQFHYRYDAKTDKVNPKLGDDLDSTQLMTKQQRFRKYGAESLRS